jgi:hypothetical protein
LEWKVGQFDPAGLIRVCTKHEEALFGNTGLHRRAKLNRRLQQLPASGLEAEWRNDILCDEDREIGVAQAPISIEPDVQHRRLNLLAAVHVRWRLDGVVVSHFSPLGLDLYPAAKKFETGILYDFANIEGFQQTSRVVPTPAMFLGTDDPMDHQAFASIVSTMPMKPATITSCCPIQREPGSGLAFCGRS